MTTPDPAPLVPGLANKIQLWALDRLQPYEQNAKIHGEDQVELIAKSILDYGFNNPILVDGEDIIVAGHGRLLAAFLLEVLHPGALANGVPVVQLGHLTPAMRRAYTLADNRLAELAPWDEAKLAAELDAVAADANLDELGLGWSDEELADLVNADDLAEVPTFEDELDQVDEDKAGAELAEKWKTEVGQVWRAGRHELRVGDCRELMAELDADTFSAILTDPPYGLDFMGKGWDHGVPGVEFWQEALRVAKPGAPLIAFGGTRTYHRLAVAIEDAGFEIRDCLTWLYGSGFPKSLDISKAIDRQRFARDEVLEVTAWVASARDAAGLKNSDIDDAFGFCGMAGHWTSKLSQPAVPTVDQVPKLLGLLKVTDPPPRVLELLIELNGPKGEPGPNWWKREVVGSKRMPDSTKCTPGFAGKTHSPTYSGETRQVDITEPATPAAQVWNGWGTALKPAWEPALLAMKPTVGTFAENAEKSGVAGLNIDGARIGEADSPESRWPANVALDSDAAAELDEQTGTLHSGANPTRRGADKFRTVFGDFKGATDCDAPRGADSGGASRFFYTAKASTVDRGGEFNQHPTVKPTALMEWLARLTLTPTGGTVLEPFAGSGTTIVACERVGRPCVAMEQDTGHAAIILERLHRLGLAPELVR